MYIPAQLDIARKFFGAAIVDAAIQVGGQTETTAKALILQRTRILRARHKESRNVKHGRDKILSRSAFQLPSAVLESIMTGKVVSGIDGRRKIGKRLSHNDPIRPMLPCADDLRTLRVLLDLRRAVPATGRLMHEMIDAGHELRLHLWVPVDLSWTQQSL